MLKSTLLASVSALMVVGFLASPSIGAQELSGEQNANIGDLNPQDQNQNFLQDQGDQEENDDLSAQNEQPSQNPEN